MSIRADEITEILKSQIKGYETRVDVAETGVVLSVGDGIARVHGLEKAMAGELLEFPGDVRGIVLNLEEDNVGIALLGDDQLIKEGDRITSYNVCYTKLLRGEGGHRKSVGCST